MKTKTIYTVLLSSALVLAAGSVQASSVTGLTTFSPNTTAKSSEVNGNFSTVQTAVDDNNTRLTTVEGKVSTNTSNITTLQGTTSTNSSNITSLQSSVSANGANISTLQSNPGITGNLTLPESTDANTGNIMKGTVPFLHDYGVFNTFLGENAGNFSLTTGGYNTAIGTQALMAVSSGSYNTASGVNALTSNNTGADNTASGFEALYQNTGGNENVANGYLSLYSNTTGSNDTAIGSNALYGNTVGMYNTASGNMALYTNANGGNNSAFGYFSLEANVDGFYNTAVGDYALDGNTSGYNNIALGYDAGVNVTTGSYNIDIGNNGVAGDTNTIRIGDVYNSGVTPASGQDATFIAGINGVTVPSGTAVLIGSNGQLGTATSSRRFKDHIRSMGSASDVLNRLHPVTFYYKTDHDPKGRHLQYGLVAEDVAKVAPSLVVYGKNGKPDGIYYRFLAPMLLNQYQKQEKVIRAQGATLKTQAALLHKQAREIIALRKQAAQVAVLQKQMARINTILAMRNQPQRVAEAGAQ